MILQISGNKVLHCVNCRRRKLPPAVTPASTYATTTIEISTLNRHKEGGSYEQGTPEAMAASQSGSDYQNKLSSQSSETSAVTEHKCPGVIDEDLLLGLCPEDLLNCSTSFCTSLNDSASVGHIKCETFPAEVKTPSIESPNYPLTTNMVSLHSTPVHSTPKPSIYKQQSTFNVPTDRLGSAIDSEAPIHTSRSQCSIPSNTFYGLPLKVKQCMEEHRGITQLYGN